MVELHVGSQGSDVSLYTQAMVRRYSSYATEPDGITQLRDDKYFGNSELRVHNQWQGRMRRPIRSVGTIVTAEEFDFIVHGKPFFPGGFPKVWIYSAAGTGASWNIGPQYDAAEFLKKLLNCQHQPCDYPAGGFLGLMGGDPKISYNDSIENLYQELLRLVRLNPNLNDPDLELWFFGYSQSADGMKRSVNRIFGDGGPFAHLRSKIKGLVLFGDPTRAPGSTKESGNPRGYGIARWDAPQWIDNLTHSITTWYDMYACAEDSTLLALFYEWFVRAETELPFVVYSASIVIPAISSYFDMAAPILIGTSGAAIISGITGVGLPFIAQMISGYGGGSPNPELIQSLSAQGLLTPKGIFKVIRTLVALSGIQTHGEYHLPKTEFNGRNGIQVACDIVRGVYGK